MDTTVKYRTANLIEYEVIMDVDLAIVKAILEKIQNKAIYNPIVLRCHNSINPIKNLLLFRRDKNPLSVILSSKYKDSCGTILKELEDKYSEMIVKNTSPNDIFFYVNLMEMNSQYISNTILCKTKSQEEKIKKLIPTITTTLDPHQDMKNYDCLFVKYADNFFNYTGLQGKHLYLYNAAFNLGEKYELPETVVLLSKTNKIRTIDPYKTLRVPNMEVRDIYEQRIPGIKN